MEKIQFEISRILIFLMVVRRRLNCLKNTTEICLRSIMCAKKFDLVVSFLKMIYFSTYLMFSAFGFRFAEDWVTKKVSAWESLLNVISIKKLFRRKLTHSRKLFGSKKNCVWTILWRLYLFWFVEYLIIAKISLSV